MPVHAHPVSPLRIGSLLLLASFGPGVVLVSEGCGAEDGSSPATVDASTGSSDGAASDGTVAADTGTSGSAVLDPSLFIASDLASAITERSCKLSDGSTGTCYAFTVSELPTVDGYGPWCPKTTSETGGIWVGDGAVDGKQHTVDGAYLTALDNAKGWSIVNADGTVNVTTDDQFPLVAKQEVGGYTLAQAQASGVVNHCIQGTPKSHAQTILLPKVPVPATGMQSTMDLPGGAVGIALNGILYFPPEPTARIETYHNIAPLDVHGGHTGFGSDYHFHRAFDVTGVPDAKTKIYGYLFDGYCLYRPTEPDGTTPSDLDGCRGHTTSALGYHYHASASTPFITTCLHGVHATEMGHG